MRIAMIGSRGLNSNYGGIETCLDALCPKLAALGCEVDVYGRDSNYRDVEGLRSIPTPAFGSKKFETISRSVVAVAKTVRHYDVIHFHALGPGILSMIAAGANQRSVVTVHNLDYLRSNFGMLDRMTLYAAEKVLVRCASEITVVSKTVARHFESSYGRVPVVIPHGFAPRSKLPRGEFLQRYGLGAYLLFAGRLTQEKGCHDLITAFNNVSTDLRLVIAGSAVADNYEATLRSLADPNKVSFVGHVSGDTLAELYSNAYLHVLPSYTEGMSMSLLEALSYGVPSLVSDIPPNRDMMGDAGFYVKVGDVVDLEAALTRLTRDRAEVAEMATRLAHFQRDGWTAVASKYFSVYRRVARPPEIPVSA